MALTRDQVVRAGLGLLDEYGLADLSMRRIAQSLEVQPSALYHHVPDKQTLLAAIADLVLTEVPAPLGRWRPAVADWAHGLRAALLLHRDSGELVATARAFGLLTTDVIAHPRVLFAAAGLSPDQAEAAATTLLHFVLGHVAGEQARLDWERYGRPAPGEARPSDVATFASGIELILAGVEHQG